MKKRILALILVVVMLVGSVPFVTAAEYQSEEDRILQQCKDIFYQALYASGRSNFRGYCGLQTGLQIWKLGLTESAMIYDGNDYYDQYKQLDVTSTGYKVDCYGANTYTLEEALNTVSQCGTQNVYNIIVGFQSTNTYAGSMYGHAMFIHAILDGYVYFVEDFYTVGAARTPIKCTIKEFSDYFCAWARFEGIVVLGQKVESDFCQKAGTDLFVVSDKTDLLAQPAADAVSVRQVSQGEVFHATALLTDDSGNRYYQVTGGYLPVSVCTLQRVNSEGVCGELVTPEMVYANTSFWVSGSIRSPHSDILAARLEVVDLQEQVVQTIDLKAKGHLKNFSQRISGLAQGAYRLQLVADIANRVDAEEQVQQIVVDQWFFGIGQAVMDTPAQSQPVIPDGWNYIDGVRYFYQNGAPRVGWYCDNGADYYFKEDGSVTIGWAEINGRWRYFSDTGVMRTGWLETNDGTYYMLSNGVAALGEKTIDGVTYTFSDEGILQE